VQAPGPAFGAAPRATYEIRTAVPITAITPHLAHLNVVGDALQRLAEGRVTNFVDYPEAAGAALMAATIDRLANVALVVTTRQERAESLASALAEYLPPDRNVNVWNSPDALPYEQLPVDLEAGVQRVHGLDQLLSTEPGSGAVWVVSIHGLMQLVVPPSALRERTKTLRVGKREDIEALHRWAIENGYVSSPVVQEPGTIARRGGIVDLFPPGVEHPHPPGLLR
jgi:transcription-repair coupling factor (superfamily II helicase)